MERIQEQEEQGDVEMEETEVTLAPAAKERQIAMAIVISKGILETAPEFKTEVGKAIGDLHKQR
jgi:hypothetical protein